jgi:hypothetical protein
MYIYPFKGCVEGSDELDSFLFFFILAVYVCTTCHTSNVDPKICVILSILGIGLLTWSPVSFGLCPGDKTEDATQFFIKLANKVK